VATGAEERCYWSTEKGFLKHREEVLHERSRGAIRAGRRCSGSRKRTNGTGRRCYYLVKKRCYWSRKMCTVAEKRCSREEVLLEQRRGANWNSREETLLKQRSCATGAQKRCY
jgi:hypothetical protein